MSYTKGSTVDAEEVSRKFQANPVGYVVKLDDDSLAQVREYRDTPKGRWYRLRRRGLPWVPDVAVVAVVVYSVGLVKEDGTVPLGAGA